MSEAINAPPLLKPMEFYITGNDLDKTESYRSDLIEIRGNEYQQVIIAQLRGNFPAAATSILPTPIELRGSVYLGDLVTILGAPDYVLAHQLAPRRWLVTMLFKKVSYEVFAYAESSENALGMWAELNFLSEGMTGSYLFNQETVNQWKGFASIGHYLPR